MLYQIYDIAEKEVKEDSYTFEQARDFVAGHWETFDEDAPDYQIHHDIMNTETMDQLNPYAEGLDYIIERMS